MKRILILIVFITIGKALFAQTNYHVITTHENVNVNN